MAKKENKNLDDLFGPANGFGQVPFGGGFGSAAGFGTGGFGQAPFGGFGTGGFTGNNAKEIIEGYEKEITKVDSDTRDDLINIDIELGKMTAFQGFGAGYSRLIVKEHISNITKRYREAVLTLSTLSCVLGAALIIEKIRNKK